MLNNKQLLYSMVRNKFVYGGRHCESHSVVGYEISLSCPPTHTRCRRAQMAGPGVPVPPGQLRDRQGGVQQWGCGRDHVLLHGAVL